jgi:hypothetical protein
MPNTGGPVMRWNMRREYSADPASERKLYYSGIDKRYHLQGAREGWLEIGHLVNETKDLEFRYFDSDGDGYLDTTQVFEGTNPVPVRVSHVRDVRADPVTLKRETMQDEYNNRILPAAIHDDELLIGVLKKLVQPPLAAAYETEAGKAESAERKRFCLDVAREFYFLRARDLFYTRNASNPYLTHAPAKNGSRTFTPGSADGGYTLGDTIAYWKIARLIESFAASYDNGEITTAAEAASELAKLLGLPQ